MLPDRSSTIWIATPCVDVFNIAPSATHRNTSGNHRTRDRNEGRSRDAIATLENVTADVRVRRSRHHSSIGSPLSNISTQGIAK
jgi:hypothetical protein